MAARSEQRRQKRIPFNQHILINNSIKGSATDISEGGMYVHTGRMFNSGSLIDISVPVKSRSLSLKAEVKHCEEGVGMGLEFVNIEPSKQVELKNTLSELAITTSGEGKKKILIVDANEAVKRMIKSRLVLDGFSVFEAKNAAEAQMTLEEEQMDMVILDVGSETMNGFEAITHIRQMPRYKDIPIIAWAVKSTSAALEEAKNAGAAIFLQKTTTSPIKMSENVKKLLKR